MAKFDPPSPSQPDQPIGENAVSRPAWHAALFPWLVISVISLVGCGGGTNSTPPPSTPPPVTFSQKIKHVVVIFQENRTPDNLFHGLPNADIADSGVNSAGQIVPLTPITLANDYDLSHAHQAFVKMYDGGRMDGADKIAVSCAKGATDCPPPNPQFKYVNPSEVTPYFQLAEQYAFADRMFQTNQGPSFPAHQFIISGTSAPTATSTLFAAENPTLPSSAPANSEVGCDAPVGTIVQMLDPSGLESVDAVSLLRALHISRFAGHRARQLEVLHALARLDLDRTQCHSAPSLRSGLDKQRHREPGTNFFRHLQRSFGTGLLDHTHRPGFRSCAL